MITNQPFDTDNERRYASWIARDGRNKALAHEPGKDPRRVAFLKRERARHLEAVTSLTNELQALGVE